MRFIVTLAAAGFAAFTLSACATTDRAGDRIADTSERLADNAREGIVKAREAWEANKSEEPIVADPLEPINRVIFKFNMFADDVLLEPAANVYAFVLPQWGRNRVRDFIDNLKHPVWFANSVLQGDLDLAGRQAARFGVNSTIGVLGFYDVAGNELGMPVQDEDFGQTLGVWGVGDGAYLMLPLIGPTTTRDFTGLLVDTALDPITWAEFEGDDELQISRRVVDVVDIRDRSRAVADFIEESVDPYAQLRATYIQGRRDRVTNGRNTYEELPEFD